MTTQETADLRAMAGTDLRRELDESQRALFNLRFQAATRQLADVSQVRQARRRVARIKTLLRERAILVELGALDAEEEAAPVATAPANEPAELEETADEPAEEAVAEEDIAEDEQSADEEAASDDEPADDDEDRE